ncbi:MAG: hypothetical protein J7M12_01110, partial [Candidatus Hydrogenedentes bacterium]|nr:hypothetical protein [Candidatus Hydrogenedentota bacterium]
ADLVVLFFRAVLDASVFLAVVVFCFTVFFGVVLRVLDTVVDLADFFVFAGWFPLFGLALRAPAFATDVLSLSVALIAVFFLRTLADLVERAVFFF